MSVNLTQDRYFTEVPIVDCQGFRSKLGCSWELARYNGTQWDTKREIRDAQRTTPRRGAALCYFHNEPTKLDVLVSARVDNNGNAQSTVECAARLGLYYLPRTGLVMCRCVVLCFSVSVLQTQEGEPHANRQTREVILGI